MEMQKEAEAKKQQEKLKSKELFNNLHVHLGPHVNVVEPPLVEVTSQSIPENVLTTINTSGTPREITPLIVVASNGVSFNDSILFNVNLLMQQRLPPTVQPPPLPPTTPAPAPIENHVPVPPPSPPKSPSSIPQPLSTTG
ncbi:hypothetical protein GmHk_12G034863 [Glycine max]|nr:hypothetical protein GmHk_12G034863 [Glycine max]